MIFNVLNFFVIDGDTVLSFEVDPLPPIEHFFDLLSSESEEGKLLSFSDSNSCIANHILIVFLLK